MNISSGADNKNNLADAMFEVRPPKNSDTFFWSSV